MDRKIDASYTADYLWEEKGIVPFLKIDQGLCEPISGVQLMKPMPNLASLLERAKERKYLVLKCVRSLKKRMNKALNLLSNNNLRSLKSNKLRFSANY